MNPLRRLRPRTLVLCYHRVAELAADSFDCCVTPAHFAEHLEVLQSARLVRPFSELHDSFRPGRRPGARAVILTFDDGYADNLHTAAPLLRRHGCHAMFYICTEWVRRQQEAWWDRLERAILEGPLPPGPLRLPGLMEEFDTRDRKALLAAVYPLFRDGPNDRREVWLSFLAAPASAPARESHRPLTVEELRQLAAEPGMHIGAHTVTHPLLPSLGRAELESEIAGSRRWLERELGRPVRDFSYPHGAENPHVRGATACAGLVTAVTCESRPVRRNDDALGIPRMMVRDWTGNEFAQRLEAWFNS